MPANPLTTNTNEAQILGQELETRGFIREGMPEQEVIRQFDQEAKRLEQQTETAQFEDSLHETPSAPYGIPPQVAGAVSSQPIIAPKSEFFLALEKTLAEGVGDMYARMEPNLRAMFKEKGEEVARKIEAMVASGKARFKQILAWIKEWLRMIPGVNKFFLEQEAKIKADKIFAFVR